MKKPKIHIINNAVVALYPMREVEAVTAFSRFYAGSWHEGESWGAHHLLEHVMFDGSESFPTEEEFEIFKEENGIYTNGSTGDDGLMFTVRMPKGNVSAGLKAHFDTVFRPLLKESEIEREKTVIAQEYRDKWSNPSARFNKNSDINSFGEGHKYMRDGMGEIDYVKTVTREQLVNIHKEFVVPANMIFVCVGNFSEKEVLNIFEKEVAERDSGSKHNLVIEETKLNKSMFIWKEDVQKVSIYVEWFNSKVNINADRRTRIILSIATYLIGGSTRSLLWKELRNKRGWVYSANANFSIFPDRANFSVGTSTDPQKAQQVLDLLISIPRDFVKNGIPDEIFRRANRYLDSLILMSYDSVGAIADKISSDLYRSPDNHIYLPEEINEIGRDITQDEVRKAIEEFLASTPIVSVMSNQDPKLKI